MSQISHVQMLKIDLRKSFKNALMDVDSQKCVPYVTEWLNKIRMRNQVTLLLNVDNELRTGKNE